LLVQPGTILLINLALFLEKKEDKPPGLELPGIVEDFSMCNKPFAMGPNVTAKR
jgi:hypothetical protein